MHPKMGAKKMYHILRPAHIGRDKFMALYKEHGYVVCKYRNYQRTTFSTRSHRYHNLLENKVLTDINQLWSSDITYIEINGKFFYISLLMDVYSRRILGYHLSPHLQASASVRCLQMALATRKHQQLSNLIHHSDRGVQYSAVEYTNLLEQYHIAISMCSSAYENAHIERVNGIIKQEYLYPLQIQTFEQGQCALTKAVKCYNDSRPHTALGLLSPIQYEQYLLSIPLEQRTHMRIYTEIQSIDEHSQQLNLNL
jgi:transposase InsO family protein